MKLGHRHCHQYSQTNKTKELKDRFAEEFSILTEDLFNIGILAVKESRKIQSDQQQQI